MTDNPENPRIDGPAEDEPTRVESTPPPAASTARGSDAAFPIEPQDLLSDGLLATAARMTVGEHTVPSLGDIALLSRLGHGGMGAVYLGYKPRLRRMVAVKVLPLHLIERQPQLAERFLREAQIAASIESPHLVRVTDVEDQNGLFFLVMEYVDGVTAGTLLKDAARSGERLSEADALDLVIAATKGLAVAHSAGVVHRDVKPDNILVPRGRDGALRVSDAKVSDLGLARNEDGGQALTGTDIGMGTPGYMAPEQAMSARSAGKPADIFSMGGTLYALLSGHAPFRGESSTAVVMATIQQPHVPLRQLRPDLTEATARLVDVCLNKLPHERFADAPALLEALEQCRQALASGVETDATIHVVDAIRNNPERGAPVAVSNPSMASVAAAPVPSRARVWIGLVAVLFVVLAAMALGRRTSSPSSSPVVGAAASNVTIGVAHSSERERWLEWAVSEFARTPEGAGTRINLLPMDEQAAEQALAAGDSRIHVWSPASSIYTAHVERQWTARRGETLIASQALLSLTPQVFVMFVSRHDVMVKRYGRLDFSSLRSALREGSWATIGQRPEWGDFSFAITDPHKYSNGLAALALMSAEHHGRDKDLRLADVQGEEFHQWVQAFEPAFESSGTPMQAMLDFVLKGPSSYDGVFTFESTALAMIDDAADRWEPVRIIYPRVNIWNDAQYYVLHVPWSNAGQRAAAEKFKSFLLDEAAQGKLVELGFRPADPDVHIRTTGSPFLAHDSQGGRIAIPETLEQPSPEIIEALIGIGRPQGTTAPQP